MGIHDSALTASAGRSKSRSTLVSPAGHHIQITNVDGDDYVRDVMTIRVTDPDGHVLHWTLPERLTRRADVLAIVVEEMQAALRERRERAL